jgi:hypothetical protein
MEVPSEDWVYNNLDEFNTDRTGARIIPARRPALQPQSLLTNAVVLNGKAAF